MGKRFVNSLPRRGCEPQSIEPRGLVNKSQEFIKSFFYFFVHPIYNIQKMPYARKYSRARTTFKKAVKGRPRSAPLRRTVLRRKAPVRKTLIDKRQSRQIAELKRLVNATIARLEYRARGKGYLSADSGELIWTTVAACYRDTINTAISAVPILDPTDPTSPTLINLSTQTDAGEIMVKKMTGSITLRNNFIAPCKAHILCCAVRNDSNISPYSAYGAGLADKDISVSSSPLTHPLDSSVFQKLWKVVARKTAILNSGQEITVSHSEHNVKFDPALADATTLTYKTADKGFMFLIGVEGVISHDTSQIAEVGQGFAAVDYLNTNTFKIEYDAGASYDSLQLADGATDTFTNAVHTGAHYVSDNVEFTRG